MCDLIIAGSIPTSIGVFVTEDRGYRSIAGELAVGLDLFCVFSRAGMVENFKMLQPQSE